MTRTNKGNTERSDEKNVITFKTEFLAECLGVTPRRIRQLRDEGVLKETQKGLYEPKENIRSYIDYITQGADGGSMDYFSERAGLVRAKREMAELELRKERGELHETKDIEQALGSVLMRFRARLLAIPTRFAPKAAVMKNKEDIHRELTREIHEALEELSELDSAKISPA